MPKPKTPPKPMVPELELERRRVPLTDLAPWPGNARQGDVDAVRESLRTHGQYRPLVVQKQTMRVIAGNHTLRALEAEGRSHALIDVLDVSDEQAARINLVDNRSQDLASYDNQALAAQLASLGGDLDGTGYDQQAYDALIDSLGDMTPDDGDEVLEPPADEDEHSNQYGVIVTLPSEQAQEQAYDRLRELAPELDALDVKVVTV